MKKRKVLFISQEMTPFLPESEMAKFSGELALSIMSAGNEIRNFMPRYGLVNERRHQLHEVIRLSGINLIVNNMDYPLIIKVASIQPSRMQVYFVENEDFFKRKALYGDITTPFFADNDERVIFFSKGVIETVKKLGWAPEIIICNGWKASLVPLYLKTIYKNEPLFARSKVVVTLFNEAVENSLTKDFAKKVASDNINLQYLKPVKEGKLTGLYELAVEMADGVMAGTPRLASSLRKIYETSEVPKLDYIEHAEERIEAFHAFADEVIEKSSLLVN